MFALYFDYFLEIRLCNFFAKLLIEDRRCKINYCLRLFYLQNVVLFCFVFFLANDVWLIFVILNLFQIFNLDK